MVSKKKVPKKQIIKKKTGLKKFTRAQLGAIAKFMSMGDEELQKHLPDPAITHGWNNKLEESEVEARLVMVHRLVMRGITTTDMAHQMGCSTHLIRKLRIDLKARNIKNMNAMKWEGYIAETLAFYDEMKTSAVMISGAKSASAAAKVAAIGMALKADTEKQAFLVRLGIFGDDSAKLAAQGHFLPSEVEDEEHHHDRVAVEAVTMISEELKKGVTIDVVAEQVFDE